MNTTISRITDNETENKQIYEAAGRCLRAGGLVAFPTETVYGLGANALDSTASAKIYSAKGRPSDNPLIVHIADLGALYELAAEVPEAALKLAEAFWPGPLTMILKKREIVPDTITGGLDTVAIRMPSHPVAAALIRTSGVFIAAPSANTSGKPSPTTAAHVIHDLDGRIDMIVADDSVEIGIESTIVDLSVLVPTILRPGFITLEMLSDVVGAVRIDPAIMGSLKEGTVPKAPGMKYKHYAPDAQLVIVEGNPTAVTDTINRLAAQKINEGYRVGVMATEESMPFYHADVIVSMGRRQDPAQAAHNLYAALRSFDEQGIQFIFSEHFSPDNVGQAVMNRLMKAAGHTIIKA